MASCAGDTSRSADQTVGSTFLVSEMYSLSRFGRTCSIKRFFVHDELVLLRFEHGDRGFWLGVCNQHAPGTLRSTFIEFPSLCRSSKQCMVEHI